MLEIIKNSFLTGLRFWKIVLLVYFLQLLLAVPLAMQVWHVLEASIGSSLQINKLLAGYDHTVFSDFLKVHGGSITPLIGQLRWVLLVWALASVFINAGVLSALIKKTPTGAAFWSGGAMFFFRFAKIAGIFLLLVLVWTGVVLLPYLGNLMGHFETMATERTVLGYLGLLVVGCFVGIIYFYNASIIARTAIIKEGLTTWQALKKGLSFNLRNFPKTTAIFLIFSGLQLLALAIYWWLEGKSGMISPALIVVFFVLQQLMVLVRVMGRVMIVQGVSERYPTKN